MSCSCLLPLLFFQLLSLTLHFGLGFKRGGIKYFIQLSTELTMNKKKKAWALLAEGIQSGSFRACVLRKEVPADSREHVIFHRFFSSEGERGEAKVVICNLRFSGSKLGSWFCWRFSVKVVWKLTFSY